METVAPFRAWRYAPAAGDLDRLVAPPYDVIGPDLQSRLYARSRHNVVRVDLGMRTPSDNDCDNQYTRAATQLARWKDSAILVRDAGPSLTFVEESFTGPDGQARVRRGVLAVMRLYGFDEGVVFPHEQTLAGPKEDRFRLMAATAMSLSPVFLLYDLPGDEITRAWQASLKAETQPVAVTDDSGTDMKLWATTDAHLLRLVSQTLVDSRFVIADGHHRYETALRYRDHRREEARDDRLRRPAADYCLAYITNMSDPALAVFGTHRLISGLAPELVAALPFSLAGSFEVERLIPVSSRDSVTEAREAIVGYLEAHPRGAFGLWGPGFDAAYGLRLTDRSAVRAAVPGHSAAYQALDVTVLQSLILERALGINAADMAAEKYVAYFKDSDDAFARLARGDFQAGFFMNPTGLDQIRETAFAGERMPQKATFFYPKLPTGLVFHDLNGSL